MKITGEQQEKVLEKLKPIFKDPCRCGGSNWIFSDTIFELREFNGGDFVIGGKSSSAFPVITVTCGNCGNTHLFNAILLELVEKKNDGGK